jgi:hypothetical protein
METFKNIDFKKISIPKLIGLILLGLIIFIIATSLIGFAFRTAFNTGGGYSFSPGSAPRHYAGEMMEEAHYDEEYSMKLSASNIMPPPYPDTNTTGNDAESYEVTEYNGHIKTGNLNKACDTLETLKDFGYVIFENANRNESNCNYTFKVENQEVPSIIEVIKGLKPESLNENTHTIKTLVEGYTSEVEILEKKLSSIEETLLDAQRAYDQVEVLATRTQDVESLAKIIDSKIQLIERLTNERINIKERIDRLNREKADQIDRLNYTYFGVYVTESNLVDLRGLKNSWEWEIKRFVNEFNGVLQKITINLIGFLLQLSWIALYLVLALFVVKYGWRGAKYIWRK